MQDMARSLVAQLRRQLYELIGAVIILDGVVIAIYYGMHVPDRPYKQQEIFVGVWMVLTLLVVASGMGRIRATRMRIRQARAGGSGARATGADGRPDAS
jgi:hypothetical protein